MQTAITLPHTPQGCTQLISDFPAFSHTTATNTGSRA